MKHQEIYNTLITRAQERQWTRETSNCYVEEHHVIPRSVGGSDDPDNLVILTAKEHYIAHLLLVKIYKNTPHSHKMCLAIIFMAGKGRIITSRLYENIKAEYARVLGPRMSELHKGVPKTDEHKEKLRILNSGENNAMWGKRSSEKQKEAVRKANTGKIVTKETREKMRKNGLKRKHTPETIEKMRLVKLGKKLTPEHAAKARVAAVGNVQTDYQKQKAREANQSSWNVMSPDGLVQIITNLNAFCKENQLDQGNMVAVSKGRLKQHKGWKCSKIVLDS